MSGVAPLLTVLVTLLAVLHGGTAIRCYQCSDDLAIGSGGDSAVAGASDGLQQSTRHRRDGGDMFAGVNDGLQHSLGDLGNTLDGLQQLMGNIGTQVDDTSADVNDGLQKSRKSFGALGGLLKSIGDQIPQSPCTEFQPDQARFQNENCLFGSGCMKTVKDGVTTRSCSPIGMDFCSNDNNGTETCVCSSDYCNAAGHGAPVPLLLLLLPVAVLALLNSRL